MGKGNDPGRALALLVGAGKVVNEPFLLRVNVLCARKVHFGRVRNEVELAKVKRVPKNKSERARMCVQEREKHTHTHQSPYHMRYDASSP